MILLTSCAHHPTTKMVDSPVMVTIPSELTNKVEYPTCRYSTNINLAECIQSTRGVIDIINKNLEAIALIVSSAALTSTQ